MSECSVEIVEQERWKATSPQRPPQGSSFRWDSIVVPNTYRATRSLERKIQLRTVIVPKIHIMNIPFVVRRGEELMFVESERWPSLTSSGTDLQEAVSEMTKLLGDVIDEYVLAPAAGLSEDSLELREYLLKKLF